MTEKDVRIFYNRRTRDYVITNDYKMRRLLSMGYDEERAKKESHGHIRDREKAKEIKQNILGNKREKERCKWILGCYVRICDNEYKHYEWVKGIHNTISNREKKHFYRVNRGGVR